MKLKSIVFKELPVHDTVWSITTGADGKIYAGVCGESTGGLSVFIVRYDPDKEEYEYLLEVGTALNEPTCNGRAPQSKIHYCLLPSSCGKLYCATHCSGPPHGHSIWRPLHTWDDPERMFSGFHIFVYDPRQNEVIDFGVMSPNEGSRAMALAEKRQKLYGITWPRNHFYVYDLKSSIYMDMGRIGDINPQSVWIDTEENAYTVDDLGYIVKFFTDENKLVHYSVQVPHDPSDSSLPRSVYDTTLSPDGQSVYGVTWNLEKVQFCERLFRYDLYEGDEGKMYDLGPAYAGDKLDHAGGLVFGDDGYLYFTASRVERKRRVPFRMYLFRLDTQTLKKDEIGPVDDGEWHSEYIAKATKDFAGNLYFADTNNRPTRIYVYTPERTEQRKNKTGRLELKPWG